MVPVSSQDNPTPADVFRAAAGDSQVTEVFVAACSHAREVALLATVDSLLQWDEQTMLPAAAGDFRAEQAAAMAALVHARRTDKAHGERLQQLAESELATSGSPAVRATIRLFHEDFQKQSRVAGRLVEALARTAIEAQQAWSRGLAAADWNLLAPYLESMFALKRELAGCQRPDLDPYDALLDDYEPGADSRSIQERFARLRAAIVPLVQACGAASTRPSDAVLRGDFPLSAQQEFVKMIAAAIGFDFHRGRLDTTVHPFCSTLGPHDCRLTTRWDEHFLPTALFSVLHEAGHGLYEQGLSADWFGLPPGEAASLGIHESQSRLWENLVGRSASFWEWCFPAARAAFPTALAEASPSDLAAAVLTVQPSFIRVEADEVTYNLHVMLRFDLERAVIKGELSVADLPGAWDERFAADFGQRPPTPAQGVMQDIHWPAGLIGYFPTYTLGNLFSAQIMAAAETSLGDLPTQIGRGEFRPLLDWLRQEVHATGRTLTSDQLVTQVSGEPVNERYLIESLYRRYGPVHGLSDKPPAS